MITLTPTHKKRLLIVMLIILGTGTAAALGLTAFSKNLLYFFSPSQIKAGEAPIDRSIRIGGMVQAGSVHKNQHDLAIQFVVTDYEHSIPVDYTGILPDLFREGQGIIAIGKMQTDGRFLANEVLAKHDENYMPPEVAATLKNPPTSPQKSEHTLP